MEVQTIQQKICEVRGVKVMFDFDLAILYQVETRVLKQAINRNMDRFPPDFLFQLTKKEWQEVISNWDSLKGKEKFSRVTPFAFTEHGVAMLASVLKSKEAVKMNIAIIRAFISLREMILHYKKYEELEKMISNLEIKTDEQFADVYKALNVLLEQKKHQDDFANRDLIGFKTPGN